MNRIKELRTDSDMKQQDLADRLKIARSVVSKYELGQVDLSTDTIRRLCEIFGVTADYLLGFSARRDPEISPEDVQLLAAYHTATPEIRTIVDTALDPYRQKKTAAAG
ncbi:MAG: helix-turn-helix transcriptional regulator [Firmicutes bacterium]|nr:helix-turn-helix transcriptional regulator [Bacillota bacterium]